MLPKEKFCFLNFHLMYAASASIVSEALHLNAETKNIEKKYWKCRSRLTPRKS
jgi:hypothetical protein